MIKNIFQNSYNQAFFTSEQMNSICCHGFVFVVPLTCLDFYMLPRFHIHSAFNLFIFNIQVTLPVQILFLDFVTLTLFVRYNGMLIPASTTWLCTQPGLYYNKSTWFWNQQNKISHKPITIQHAHLTLQDKRSMMLSNLSEAPTLIFLLPKFQRWRIQEV